MKRTTPAGMQPAKTFRPAPLIAALALALGTPATAATFVVSSGNDSGTGTLREAIGLANNCGTAPNSITFSGPFVISISNPLPAVTCPQVNISAGSNAVVIQPPTTGSSYYGGSGSCAMSANSSLTRFSGLEVRNFGNYGAYGICGAFESVGNKLSNNFKGLYITGSSLVNGNNQINNNSYGIYISGGVSNITGNTLNSNSSYGINDSVGGSTISGNTLGSNNNGIYSYGGATISNNTITNTSYGDGISGGSNLTIFGNTITDASYGGGIYVGPAATITNNIVSNNYYTGISADAGSSIQGNTVFGHSNGYGIELYDGGTIGGSGSGRNFVYDNAWGNISSYNGTSAAGPVTITNNYVGTADGITSIASDLGIEVMDATLGFTVSDNLIVGHSYEGLFVGFSGGTSPTAPATISGNKIGLRADQGGTLPNGLGIAVFAVTGPIEITGNVLSGNGGGLDVDGSSHPIKVMGNKIGTDSSGATAYGNTSGGAFFTDLSALTMTGNQVSANDGFGITFCNVTNAVVSGNTVGGSTSLRNNGTGVLITECSPPQLAARDSGLKARTKVLGAANNLFENNTVSHNTSDGILVLAGTGHTIRGGSIHTNTPKNINLDFSGGQLPNDVPALPAVPDTDTGPNGRQNYPVILSAAHDAGRTVVNFKLESTPNTANFALHFYSNDAAVPGGQYYLPESPIIVATNANGIATGQFSFAGIHLNVTATATGPEGTSEFSAALTPVDPAATVSPPALSFGNVTLPATSATQTVTITSNGTGPYRIDSMTSGASPQSCPGSGASICASGDFSCSTTCTTGTLMPTTGPSSTCTITASFHPAVLGPAAPTSIHICDNTSPNARSIALTGMGVPMVLGASPPSHNFGNVPVGFTVTTPVTLSNPSASVAASLGAPTASGSGFAIASTTCTSTLAPASSCSVTVSFTPPAVGAQAGSLNVALGNSGTPVLVALQGTGNIPYSIAPTTWNFGPQALNTQSASKAFTLSNTAPSDIPLGTMTASIPFNVVSTTCPGKIPASGSCDVLAAFTPTVNGNVGGTLTVPVTLAGAPAMTAALQGTGGQPTVSLPSSVDLGSALAGAAQLTAPVTLTNGGGVALAVGAMTTTSPFLVTHACPASLAPGASCSITVKLPTTTAGIFTGTLSVATDAPGSPNTVALSGTVQSVEGNLSLPASLGLGSTLLGSATLQQSIAVTNIGNGNLGFTSIAATAPFGSSHNCPASLAPGASCSITVTLPTTSSGNFTGTLSVATDAQGSPHTVALSGTIQAVNGNLSLPTGIDLGTAVLGLGTLQQSLAVTNTGNGNVDFTSIGATSPFGMSHNCPASLAPAATCTIVLSFAPVIYGNTTGQLTVASNALGGTRVITLLATVAGVTYGISPTDAFFGSVPVGQRSSPARSFIVSNNADVVMPLSGVTTTGPFTITENTCGASIAARGSCSVAVVFDPVQAGTTNGALNANFAFAGAPPARATLSGIGTQQSGLSLPTTVDFGAVTLGSTASVTQTVELRNSGNAVLTFTASVTGPFALGGTCGLNLLPGAACNLVLTFTPAVVGEFTGALAIVSNAPGGSRSIALIARVQPAPRPELRVDKRSIGFGDQGLGSSSAPERVTVTNVGGAVAQLGLANPTRDFRVTTQCGATLAPGASCVTDVTFAPSSSGRRFNFLLFNSDAVGSPFPVDLVGRGCGPPRPGRPPCS